MTRAARNRLLLSVLMFVLGGALLGAAIAGPNRVHHSAAAIREGGSFRIAVGAYISVDPAINGGWTELATCALLMRYPDKPLPEGARVVPEVAAGNPRVSRDGKTYTFRIRRSFRFSSGARVTAANFAYMIDRLLRPELQSGYSFILADLIVGARAVEDGGATHVSGVRAIRNTLSIRLTRPIGDFAARFTNPALCPVPTGLPIVPDGVTVPPPGSGPYYIATSIRGRQVVLKRNPFYRGDRPHHVAQFVVTVEDDDDTITRKIDRNEIDWGDGTPGAVPTQAAGDLGKRYGVNRSRFFVHPSGNTIFYLALNTERRLFRNNVPLRRAVNFALNRPALVRARGRYWGTPRDGYLPLGTPGAPPGHLYPVRGPNLAKARSLARGHTRGGNAVLYTSDKPFATTQAQIVQRNLAAIGIRVTIKPFPFYSLIEKVGTRGEPFDLVFYGWNAEWVDPWWFINALLDGRTIGKYNNSNLSYFNVPRYNRQMARAARLIGSERYRAYRRLALVLARDAAPLAVFGTANFRTFVSKRVGCVIVNGYSVGLDLAAACLK